MPRMKIWPKEGFFPYPPFPLLNSMTCFDLIILLQRDSLFYVTLSVISCHCLAFPAKLQRKVFAIWNITTCFIERCVQQKWTKTKRKKLKEKKSIYMLNSKKVDGADSLNTTPFRLQVLALPFSLTSSWRHFPGFLVAIKTPWICVNCALIDEIMLFRMIPELISRITRSLCLFYLAYLWKFTATVTLGSPKQTETRSLASDPRFQDSVLL